MRERGRVIIIEGPDGAGKTQLARKLQTWWNGHGVTGGSVLRTGSGPLEYLHQGPYKGDPLRETINLLERHPGAVVCDRLHLGEQVYGPIYRGRDALGVAGRRMLERYLLTRHAVVYLALPPFAVARESWARRKGAGGEMFPDETGYRAVYDSFRQVRTHLPLTWYDYTRSRAPEVQLLRPALSVWPRVLLIGERPGPVGKHTLRGAPPFTGRGGCAEWLAEQLDDAGIPEGVLAWINAETRGGRSSPPPRFFDEAERDGRRVPYVIALGKIAEAWCLRQEPLLRQFTVLPHPQAWRRFHARERYPLLATLEYRLGRRRAA